jgi:hypothetical protein
MVGQSGGSGELRTPAKRGRPAHNLNQHHNNNASNNNHGNNPDAVGMAGPLSQPTLGPSLQVQNSFAGGSPRIPCDASLVERSCASHLTTDFLSLFGQ